MIMMEIRFQTRKVGGRWQKIILLISFKNKIMFRYPS